MIDLTIKINSRNKNSKQFHKNGGIKCSHTRKQAMLDISKEVKLSDFYTKNYVSIESIVLLGCNCKMGIYKIYFMKKIKLLDIILFTGAIFISILFAVQISIIIFNLIN